MYLELSLLFYIGQSFLLGYLTAKMSQYNLSQVVNFLSESDSDKRDLDDSVIAPTFIDSHDGSTNEEEEGMLTDESDNDDNSDDGVDATQNQTQVVDSADPQNASPFIVSKDVSSFTPKFTRSAEQSCKITHDLTKTSSIFDIFLKIWPWSLFIQMSYYTYQRLKDFKNQK